MQEKLIISIANSTFDTIIKIAKQYKQIELYIDKLSLSVEQLSEIINVAKLVVLTGFFNYAKHFDITRVIEIIKAYSQKIIIDYPNNQLHLFDTFSFTNNTDIAKIISYHNWNINDESVINLFEIFLHHIEKYLKQPRIFVKFALQINTQQQLQELWKIFAKYPLMKNKLILIPLGEKYKKERITSLKLGSKYMFCYLNSPVVIGQLSYAEYCSQFCH